ncbi:BRO-N domain-containing protein [Acidithiobacillus ferriphilus]|uniref:BRO-N domain-containing protein n=1 Tax=Acidithiobacillus ferriphilus TaxID=1689834 RepID=UPI001C064EA7|nr:BRO family protein [Acidithiobacillus ferriphilus]MBU2853331.1 hypothetical protein [Acidithiobacillus ferriphilus]
MQEIVPFDFQGNAVRIVRGEDGEPWWVAADVSKLLDYRIAGDMTRILDEDERGTQIVRTPSGDQEMLIISESGLYHAILKSRKPEAKTFRLWVTHEVLPAIRKTGQYALSSEMPWQEAIEENLKLAELLRSCMALYGALGLRGQRRLSAVQKYLREHYGLDLEKLMPGMKDGHTMTLTELGAAFGRSAEEVSALLQELGLQILENGQWVAVDPDKVLFRIARQGPKHRFLTGGADGTTTTKH